MSTHPWLLCHGCGWTPNSFRSDRCLEGKNQLCIKLLTTVLEVWWVLWCFSFFSYSTSWLPPAGASAWSRCIWIRHGSAACSALLWHLPNFWATRTGWSLYSKSSNRRSSTCCKWNLAFVAVVFAYAQINNWIGLNVSRLFQGTMSS